MSKNRNRNIIIIVILIAILLMAVAYSALATQLFINGSAEIISEWNVKITSITAQDVSEGCNAGNPEFTDTTVTFNAELVKPGDYITYLVMIENAGTLDATLNKITLTPDENGSPAIVYTNTEPEPLLKAGATTGFLIKVAYDENTTEMPSIKSKTITGVVEYIQN